MLKRSKFTRIVWTILLVGFLLRAVGSLHDLPYSYYGDEEHFIKRALSFGSGDFNPHWFHKPAFYMYFLFVEYGLFFVFGYVVGWFDSIDQFAKYYFTDQTYFLLIGRLSTTLFSCGMVYLTYVLGARYFSEKIGLISAFFLACTYANFQSSIVVKADIPSAFFGLLALYFIMLIFEFGYARFYIFAGVSLGLGVATKLYPLLLWPCLWIAHYLRSQERKSPLLQRLIGSKLFVALGYFWCVFFLASPYSFLDPAGNMRNLISVLIGILARGPQDSGAGFSLRESEGVVDKIMITLEAIFEMGAILLTSPSMGWLLGVIGLLGMGYWGYLVCCRDKKLLIFLTYIGGFVILAGIIAPSYPTSRHISLLYPVLCLSGAHLFYDSLLFLLSKLFGIKFRGWMIVLCCCAVVLPGLSKIIAYDYRVLHKDTRLLAKEWIEESIPGGTKLVLDATGPKLQMSADNLKELLGRSQTSKLGPFTVHLGKYYTYKLAAISGVSYDITMINHPWWLPKETKTGTYRLESAHDADMGNPVKELSVMPLRFYKEQGYEYIITSSSDYAKYFREKHKLRFPSIHQFYLDLFSHATLIKEFRPDDWDRPGPAVKIFKL